MIEVTGERSRTEVTRLSHRSRGCSRLLVVTSRIKRENLDSRVPRFWSPRQGRVFARGATVYRQSIPPCKSRRHSVENARPCRGLQNRGTPHRRLPVTTKERLTPVTQIHWCALRDESSTCEFQFALSINDSAASTSSSGQTSTLTVN